MLQDVYAQYRIRGSYKKKYCVTNITGKYIVLKEFRSISKNFVISDLLYLHVVQGNTDYYFVFPLYNDAINSIMKWCCICMLVYFTPSDNINSKKGKNNIFKSSIMQKADNVEMKNKV